MVQGSITLCEYADSIHSMWASPPKPAFNAMSTPLIPYPGAFRYS